MIEETGLSINFHVGFGRSSAQEELAELLAESDLLSVVGNVSKVLLGNAACVVELIMGGVCDRHPDLKFVSVESGMGYVPFVIEGLDWHLIQGPGRDMFPGFLLPSEYFRRQIFGTFWFESDVARLIDLYPDNFMFETDYPHRSGLWSRSPDSTDFSPQETIARNLGGLSDQMLTKVLQDNADHVYGISG